MFKVKLIFVLALLLLTFHPATAISDEGPAYTGDISGRWIDDRDQVDIKQDGNVITAEIGINGSRLKGTRDGDLIKFTLNYKITSGRNGGGTGRESVGELRINSDGTRLTGTRSGGAFKKNSEWILTREPG